MKISYILMSRALKEFGDLEKCDICKKAYATCREDPHPVGALFGFYEPVPLCDECHQGVVSYGQTVRKHLMEKHNK